MNKLVLAFICSVMSLAIISCGSKNKSEHEAEQEPQKEEYTISQEVFGIPLGISSIETAISELKRRGYDVFQVDTDWYVAENIIDYEGINWDGLGLKVTDGRVVELRFMNNYSNSDEANYNLGKVSEKLKNKFGPDEEIAFDEFSQSNFITFADFNNSNNMEVLAFNFISNQTNKPCLWLRYIYGRKFPESGIRSLKDYLFD